MSHLDSDSDGWSSVLNLNLNRSAAPRRAAPPPPKSLFPGAARRGRRPNPSSRDAALRSSPPPRVRTARTKYMCWWLSLSLPLSLSLCMLCRLCVPRFCLPHPSSVPRFYSDVGFLLTYVVYLLMRIRPHLFSGCHFVCFLYVEATGFVETECK